MYLVYLTGRSCCAGGCGSWSCSGSCGGGNWSGCSGSRSSCSGRSGALKIRLKISVIKRFEPRIITWIYLYIRKWKSQYIFNKKIINPVYPNTNIQRFNNDLLFDKTLYMNNVLWRFLYDAKANDEYVYVARWTEQNDGIKDQRDEQTHR